jgi:hypothetical protein
VGKDRRARETLWHTNLTGGYFDARLEFDGRLRATLNESMLVAGLSRDLGRVSVGGKVGVILGGSLDVGGEVFDMGPGLIVGATMDWPLLLAPKDPISLAISGQLGVATAALSRPEDETRWVAIDLRVGLTVSRTFFDVLTPYASARAFGGPVSWSGFEAPRAADGGRGDLLGSDPRHTQLAMGLGVSLASLDLQVEWAYFGETGLFAGLGVAF